MIPAGYRKYTVVMAGMIFAFVLALLGKLTAEFSTVVSVSVASFAAANAFNKRATSPNNASQEN